MAIPLKGLATAAGLLLLAACQSIADRQAAFAQEIRTSCAQRGFVPDSDAFRLCLLLETIDARLRAIERRLDLIDLEWHRGAIGSD